MSRRDSDSKRPHSKFDREPSPKRHRRDGKQDRDRDRERERERERERGRERDRVITNGEDHKDRDQRNNLPHHSKQVSKDAAADKKSNDRNEASKHSSDPTQPPRSHSYYQHDEQDSAGQVGRNSGRREAGEKVFTQSREHNGRMPASQSREPRDEKSHSKLDDNLKRRDGFREKKDDQPPTTRRFREKKIPLDSGEVKPDTTMTVKSSHADHPSERNERKEEKSGNPDHLDRPPKQIVDDRGGPNRNEARRDSFSSRARYGAGGGNGNYRPRDKFHGRQGYHPKTQTEKWKHDLYQEVNKDPIQKSEDDQIAKLEALLQS